MCRACQTHLANPSALKPDRPVCEDHLAQLQAALVPSLKRRGPVEMVGECQLLLEALA